MSLENSLSSTCTHWRHIQLRDRTEREVVFSLWLRRYVPSEKQPTYTHSAVFFYPQNGWTALGEMEALGLEPRTDRL